MTGSRHAGPRGRIRPDPRARLAALGLVALWAAGAVPASATAQGLPDPPGPGFRAETHPEGIRLVVDVPEGWALYAPALPSGPEGRVGLPLRIEARGAPVVPIRWPEPVRSDTPIGPARVHPAGTLHGLLPPIPPRDGPLQVSWALCRRDLCVPGRSLVALPASR